MRMNYLMKIPITSKPFRFSSIAATDESIPPDIIIATFVSFLDILSKFELSSFGRS